MLKSIFFQYVPFRSSPQLFKLSKPYNFYTVRLALNISGDPTDRALYYILGAGDTFGGGLLSPRCEVFILFDEAV